MRKAPPKTKAVPCKGIASVRIDQNWLLDETRDILRKGASLVQSSSGKHAGRLVLRPFGSDGDQDSSLPILYDERCVLIVDLVGWSRRTMEEQYALVESMNGAFLIANRQAVSEVSSFRSSRPLHSRPVWDIYKGTGDGAIFVFGKLVDPTSVREALLFSARTMSAFHRHNQQLAEGAVNTLSARMALAYGRVYLTRGLDGRLDVLGDAINLCARLVGSQRASAGTILVEEGIYHRTMVSADMYYRNEDGSNPRAGQLSDFVLGTRPSGTDFLYFQDDGYHETKDRTIRAYNLAGRLGGIEIRRASQ